MRSSLGTEEDIHSSHDTHFRLSVRREGTCLAGVREKKRVLVTGTLGKSALATDQAREASQADRESNPSFFLGQVAVKVNLSHTVLSCRTSVSFCSSFWCERFRINLLSGGWYSCAGS